jgi:hypothetical protein
MSMSKFATQADYWKDRAEQAEAKLTARRPFSDKLAQELRRAPEATAQVPDGMVLMPKEPPDSIPAQGYDDELFQHCRDDDYQGMYRTFVKRVGIPPQNGPTK